MEGIEPSLTGSEPIVHPLHHMAKKRVRTDSNRHRLASKASTHPLGDGPHGGSRL
jgi:hypothetical protein